MKIGSKWDRISECYVTNYEEIFNKGLPFFEFIKKKHHLKQLSYSAIFIFYQ